jgi:hypothetical protein
MNYLQLLDYSAIVNFTLTFREVEDSPNLDNHIRTPSNATTRYGKNRRVISVSKIPVLGAKGLGAPFYC